MKLPRLGASSQEVRAAPPARVPVAARPRWSQQRGGGFAFAVDAETRRKVRGAVLGVAGEVESFAMMVVDLVTGTAKFLQRDGFLVTRRGFLSYLATFRLGVNDLAGKRILDLGTGRSRFMATANDLLRDTGTCAVGIDRFARPPGAKDEPFAQANAFALPFAKGTFDLVLSNWFFCLFMPDLTAPRFTAEKKARLDQLVEQSVDVARGEVRISFSALHLGLGGVPYVRDRFMAHPDVAFVEVHSPRPWIGYIRAVKRQEGGARVSTRATSLS